MSPWSTRRGKMKGTAWPEKSSTIKYFTVASCGGSGAAQRGSAFAPVLQVLAYGLVVVVEVGAEDVFAAVGFGDEVEILVGFRVDGVWRF